MATYQLAPIGRQRALTDLSVVAPGARLYTYVSGTPATPQPTYSDVGGTVPNANPIIASAGGLFGPIYLPPGLAYHFVLTDTTGVLLWDQDPVMVGGLGGTVAGDLVVNGLITATGNGVHTFVGTIPGGVQGIQARNLSATGAGGLLAGNDIDASLAQLLSYGSAYSSPSGYLQPNGVVLLANGVGGLSIIGNHPNGALRFYAGGVTERLRITPTGEVLIGRAVNSPTPAKVLVYDDGATFNLITTQNLNAGNIGTFVAFLNSAGAAAGIIQQTGATNVAYVTASDRRLKTAATPATDLAALRGVAIYDFTWIADGRRDRGVFAQDAHALYPRAVIPGTDETTATGALARPWGTDYSKFVPDLIVGWQAHDAAIAELRAALAALEARR